jgi:hypothetical protein
MFNKLIDLIDEYCEFKQLLVPEANEAGAYLFTFDEITVHLITRDGKTLHAGAWIGELPVVPHPGLVLRLLRVNAPDSKNQPISIGIDERAELLCWLRIPMANLDLEGFDAVLHNLVQTAEEWRLELVDDGAIAQPPRNAPNLSRNFQFI